MIEPPTIDVAVVGAGIAGLSAASELAAAGCRVVVLEKSRGVGGRMATRRLGEAVFDHGAQFFTVRGRAFGMLVAAAGQAGAVDRWCDGFVRIVTDAFGGDELLPAGDGHARWRGVRGMTDLPKHLAAGLPERVEVRTGVRVSGIGAASDRVRITLDDGEGFESRAAVVTTPVPQALDLFASGGLSEGVIDPESHRLLSTVDYDPCFALMAVLDRPSLVPPPGGIQFESAGPARGRSPGWPTTGRRASRRSRLSRSTQAVPSAAGTSTTTPRLSRHCSSRRPGPGSTVSFPKPCSRPRCSAGSSPSQPRF